MKARAKGFIVTIDGPAGAGKSTVSRLLAEELRGCLLDTGAMYRSVAYFALRAKASTEKEFGKVAKTLKFEMNQDLNSLLVNKVDMSHKVRTQKVSQMASKVSALKAVRSLLTKRQRQLAKKISLKCPVVVEGRDIGTVVFPDVELKFFVTADAKVRARRRYLELKRHGVKGVSYAEILRGNIERDKRDSNRKIAPLRCPEDAVIVDTSSMSINQVVHFMMDHIKNRTAMAKSHGRIG